MAVVWSPSYFVIGAVVAALAWPKIDRRSYEQFAETREFSGAEEPILLATIALCWPLAAILFLAIALSTLVLRLIVAIRGGLKI